MHTLMCINLYNIGFSSTAILFFCIRFVVLCRLSCVTLHCTQQSLTDWMKQSSELCFSLGLNLNPNLAGSLKDIQG